MSAPETSWFGGVVEGGREVVRGAGLVFTGFSYWRHPKAMALGLIPPTLVLAVVILALIVVGLNVEHLTDWLSTLAGGLDDDVAEVVVGAVAAAIILALIFILAFAYVSLTLIVGETIYGRIIHLVERDYGGPTVETPAEFSQVIKDGLALSMRGLGVALIVGVVSLIPEVGHFEVGDILAILVGLVLAGRIIALEFAARPLEDRGIDRQERRALLHSRAPRLFGFGIMVHLIYAFPLGVIFVIPAAVAGGTILARQVLDTQYEG